MAGSLNKVTLIGNVGADPDARSFSDGNKVINFSIATSESWKDKNTGEKKEKTEWHRVVVKSQGLVGVVERYVKKGSKLYIEGKLETRSWEQDGQKKYTTEVVMQSFNSNLLLLNSRNENNGGGQQQEQQQQQSNSQHEPSPDELEVEIPF
jgi:single-strand DNA-binding protein